MNNFQKLKEMNIDELAKFLDENVPFDGAIWTSCFDNKYCSKCNPVTGKYEDGTEGEFAACELGDCPFGVQNVNGAGIVKMWLEAEDEMA